MPNGIWPEADESARLRESATRLKSAARCGNARQPNAMKWSG
jgi:hypothetical protein